MYPSLPPMGYTSSRLVLCLATTGFQRMCTVQHCIVLRIVSWLGSTSPPPALHARYTAPRRLRPPLCVAGPLRQASSWTARTTKLLAQPSSQMWLRKSAAAPQNHARLRDTAQSAPPLRDLPLQLAPSAILCIDSPYHQIPLTRHCAWLMLFPSIGPSRCFDNTPGRGTPIQHTTSDA